MAGTAESLTLEPHWTAVVREQYLGACSRTTAITHNQGKSDPSTALRILKSIGRWAGQRGAPVAEFFAVCFVPAVPERNNHHRLHSFPHESRFITYIFIGNKPGNSPTVNFRTTSSPSAGRSKRVERSQRCGQQSISVIPAKSGTRFEFTLKITPPLTCTLRYNFRIR